MNDFLTDSFPGANFPPTLNQNAAALLWKSGFRNSSPWYSRVQLSDFHSLHFKWYTKTFPITIFFIFSRSILTHISQSPTRSFRKRIRGAPGKNYCKYFIWVSCQSERMMMAGLLLALSSSFEMWWIKYRNLKPKFGVELCEDAFVWF